MMKLILASACVFALSSAAIAQPSQPQGGASQSPTSPTAETSKEKTDGMKKSSSAMDNKGGMNNNAAQGTTGNAGTSQGADKK